MNQLKQMWSEWEEQRQLQALAIADELAALEVSGACPRLCETCALKENRAEAYRAKRSGEVYSSGEGRER